MEQDWGIVSGVGLTALAVAAMRAIETCRRDRLIDDPYAAMLVEAADQGVGFPTTPEALAAIPEDGPRWAERVDHYLGVRSRAFDDFLIAAGAAGLRQFVILAAGLDARAYRLDWPSGAAVFELDQPKVLQFKQITLAEAGAEPACDHRSVGVDLRDDWPAALIAAGVDVTAPTVWLAEGLLPYLPGDAQLRLLESVTELSAPGSRLAVEEFRGTRKIAADPQISSFGAKQGMDLDAVLHDDGELPVAEILARLNWGSEIEFSEDAAARFGRNPGPGAAPMLDVSQFVMAVKRG